MLYSAVTLLESNSYLCTAMSDLLKLSGVVTSVKTDSVTVAVEQNSGCIGCSLKNACHIQQPDLNNVVVYTDIAGLYSVGDKVLLKESRTMGVNAVLIAFGIPLFIVIFALVFMVVMGCMELLSIAVSVLLLAAYYLLLYFYKGFVAFTVKFEIE